MKAESMPCLFVLIAHAPLASALQACAVHVLGPNVEPDFLAIDIQADTPRLVSIEKAQLALNQHLQALQSLSAPEVLFLTDMRGASPFHVAKAVAQAAMPGGAPLICGVNLPLLLRAWTYRHQPLEELIQLALTGGQAGLVREDLSKSS
jgi:PTS system mannose-specific IIA component